MADLHAPVLTSEVVARILPHPDLFVLDGTTGTGGHSEALLKSPNAPGRLVCLDQDPDALQVARTRLGEQGERVRFYRGSFSELDEILEAEKADGFDGILLDLGLNSWSLAQPQKGLSYQHDGPLRMDLDPDLHGTAGDLLRRGSEEELCRIFQEFGGVRPSRIFSRRIVQARQVRPLDTTFDLVRVLVGPRPGGVSEAELSRVFQALRVAVCREMERLERFLGSVPDWIRPGGRIVILTYASHEDQRIKEFARRGRSGEGVFRSVLEKAIRPSQEEIGRNRRARSAKLYCFEKGGA